MGEGGGWRGGGGTQPYVALQGVGVLVLVLRNAPAFIYQMMLFMLFALLKKMGTGISTFKSYQKRCMLL